MILLSVVSTSVVTSTAEVPEKFKNALNTSPTEVPPTEPKELVLSPPSPQKRSINDLPISAKFMTSSIIESMEEIDTQNMGPDWIAYFDLDDTIITHHPSLFIRTDYIYCKNQECIDPRGVFIDYFEELYPPFDFSELEISSSISPSLSSSFYLKMINSYLSKSPHIATEEGSVPDLIKQLHKNGVEILIATARKGCKEYTTHQLNNIGLEVGKGKDISKILFCGDYNKTYYMKKHLRDRPETPLGVIFVDNNPREIEPIKNNLRDYANTNHVPFHCYEYLTHAAVDNLLRELSKEEVLDLMKREFDVFIKHYQKYGQDCDYVPHFGLPEKAILL